MSPDTSCLRVPPWHETYTVVHMYVLYLLVHTVYWSCTAFDLCVIFPQESTFYGHNTTYNRRALHLPLFLPARHPESHHLLNSKIHGIEVQHYGIFPYCVSVCGKRPFTVKQMDRVNITLDPGRTSTLWWNLQYLKLCLLLCICLLHMQYCCFSFWMGQHLCETTGIFV